MQNRQKAINLLGLAERAGKLTTGAETVINNLNRRKIKAIIMASDIHDNTAEKVDRVARKNSIPIINSFSAAELSQAIGKKRKVLGLTDAGFTKALVKRINEGV
ncbi:L7Ae/L30e/S12e/Gadd45 family ribosomal protein [Lactobacillus ultunensis]|uniref:Ribosomal protein L7Ae n=1 Tax=Lactobacillus ultunensis DSM 16047 TaxID=525365 RepID=C2EKC6_9LACO|nr:ribosomal L7Ae/L30e/S12e/Gadd45 family protein [Lactobacillus ultunensis]EEJ73005.1 ribosomal protein L7Ae [Lactobacillus ultunensis DSM 16047]KRL81669.1 ribosomal protein L7 L12 [Lactobacillus ultunensis DSM 16047]QQP29343.1 ribosomal L7Ae/L30e/S12e/Gadd45 family protein [Lactobacillus ultunensis]